MYLKLSKIPSDRSWYVRLFHVGKLYRERVKVSGHKKSHRGPLVLVIDWRRFTALMAVAMVLVYFVCSVALYKTLASREHNLVEYSDVVLPMRWSRLSDQIGKTRLLQGKAAFENGDYRKALSHLRSGLRRFPEDFDARLRLATLYSAAGVPERAIALLEQGLDYGYPGNEYINDSFQIATLYNRGDDALRIIERLRAFSEVNESTERMEALDRIVYQVHLSREDYDSLLKHCKTINEDLEKTYKFYDGELVALLKLEHYIDAEILVKKLETSKVRDSHLDALRLKLLFEREGLEPVIAFYNEHKTVHRNRVEFVIRFLDVLLADDREALAASFYQEHLLHHEPSSDMLIELSSLFAERGQSQMVRNTITYSKPDQTSPLYASLQFNLVQSLMTRHRWQAALNENTRLEQWVSANENSAKICQWTRLVCGTIQDDDPASFQQLVRFLTDTKLPIQLFTKTARLFAEKQNWLAVERVAEVGLSHHPFNDSMIRLKSVALESLEGRDDVRASEIALMMEEKDKYKALAARALNAKEP